MESVWFKHVSCILNNLIAISGFYRSLEIQKILTKLSKEKNCEIIGRWKKVRVRHFYWAVASTQECLGQVKLTKFQAFLSHVTNKHKDLPNRLFSACGHGNIITPKLWMSKGT